MVLSVNQLKMSKSSDSILFPEVISESFSNHSEVDLEICIPETLAFFDGHFDQIAIVPGVTQIHWAVHYACQYLGERVRHDPVNTSTELLAGQNCLQGFYQMQVVKFKSLILPNAVIHLGLHFTTAGNKLYFRYYSQDQEYSSGRLYFTTT